MFHHFFLRHFSSYKWIYETPYIWTAEKDMKIWLIIAVLRVLKFEKKQFLDYIKVVDEIIIDMCLLYDKFEDKYSKMFILQWYSLFYHLSITLYVSNIIYESWAYLVTLWFFYYHKAYSSLFYDKIVVYHSLVINIDLWSYLINFFENVMYFSFSWCDKVISFSNSTFSRWYVLSYTDFFTIVYLFPWKSMYSVAAL